MSGIDARRIGLDPSRIVRLGGFGMARTADGYLFRPTTLDQAREVFQIASRAGRKVVLRGAGRSYGDAAIAPEAVVLDSTRMDRILAWDPTTGVLDAEPGVTIERIWRHTLEDGWWPPIVSGTMATTMGGAVAMNIHGKNAFRKGVFGEHCPEVDVLTPNGDVRTLRIAEPDFHGFVGSAGLLGLATRIRLQMGNVESGDLDVLPVSCANWDDQFACFREFERTADYMVAWLDAFAKGRTAGRGLFHAAWHSPGSQDREATLRPEHQDLPGTILGFLPKSAVWRKLRYATNRPGMRVLNSAKFVGGKLKGDGIRHRQSLVAFSFLLDYVPNWQRAYGRGGFIQYQCFVPRAAAHLVFPRLFAMQRDSGIINFLSVMKLHRPDPFLLSHGLDGYSLAMDFKRTERSWPELLELCHRMTDVVLDAGGRFYFAKDSTLRPEDVRRYLGVDAVDGLRRAKAAFDPDCLLTSSLADRLQLFEA